MISRLISYCGLVILGQSSSTEWGERHIIQVLVISVKISVYTSEYNSWLTGACTHLHENTILYGENEFLPPDAVFLISKQSTGRPLHSFTQLLLTV